jgi:hypothetical protein
MNFCAIFAGQVNIYGAERGAAVPDLEDMIKKSLNVAPGSIDDNIAATKAEDLLFGIVDDSEDVSNGNATGNIFFALAAIIFAGIIYWRCILPRMRRKRYQTNMYGERNLAPNFQDESDGICHAMPVGSYKEPIPVGFSDASGVSRYPIHLLSDDGDSRHPIPVGFSDDGVSSYTEESYYGDQNEATLI